MLTMMVDYQSQGIAHKQFSLGSITLFSCSKHLSQGYLLANLESHTYLQSDLIVFVKYDNGDG